MMQFRHLLVLCSLITCSHDYSIDTHLPLHFQHLTDEVIDALTYCAIVRMRTATGSNKIAIYYANVCAKEQNESVIGNISTILESIIRKFYEKYIGIESLFEKMKIMYILKSDYFTKSWNSNYINTIKNLEKHLDETANVNNCIYHFVVLSKSQRQEKILFLQNYSIIQRSAILFAHQSTCKNKIEFVGDNGLHLKKLATIILSIQHKFINGKNLTIGVSLDCTQTVIDYINLVVKIHLKHYNSKNKLPLREHIKKSINDAKTCMIEKFEEKLTLVNSYGSDGRNKDSHISIKDAYLIISPYCIYELDDYICFTCYEMCDANMSIIKFTNQCVLDFLKEVGASYIRFMSTKESVALKDASINKSKSYYLHMIRTNNSIV